MTDLIRSVATTKCTSDVFQAVRICLQMVSPTTGAWVDKACNLSQAWLFIQSRSGNVTTNCNNTISTSYYWRAKAWVEVLVNGVVYRSNFIYSPSTVRLYCK